MFLELVFAGLLLFTGWRVSRLSFFSRPWRIVARPTSLYGTRPALGLYLVRRFRWWSRYASDVSVIKVGVVDYGSDNFDEELSEVKFRAKELQRELSRKTLNA